jgi:hypothetical protein
VGREREPRQRSWSPATGSPWRLQRLHSGAWVTRRRRRRRVGRLEGVPAGVPVGLRDLGRPHPAGQVPGVTRARPRGHPCYCPAPRTGDPSAAAAPRRLDPPAWRLPGGGGEARQRRPQWGLCESPSPPGPPRASSATTGTATSALLAGLWHLLEVITASRRRPRQNLRLLPRPALLAGGRGPRAELMAWGGMPRMR